MIAPCALCALYALAGAQPDPACLVPDPAPDSAADPAGAAQYRAVGDEERLRGDAAAARFAYGQAVRRDPGDTRARAELAALCRPAPRDDGAHAGDDGAHAGGGDRFERAVELMRRGDRRGAAAAFEALRAAGGDPAAALLEGICALELGDDAGARPLLAEAGAEPALSGSAAFFLGLIALRDGESARASSLFAEAAAGDRSIAADALGLRRLALRDGRVVVSALSEAGFDTNVQLAPDGTPARAGSGDGYGAAVAGLFARPFGSSGPYARAVAQYRKQLRIDAYDLGDLGAALGLRRGRGGSFLVAEYAYDFVSLGGASYLSAHRLLGTGRAVWGPLSLSGTYQARLESFLTAAAAGYSGLRHDAEVLGDWQLGRAWLLGLGYHAGRDQTRDGTTSYLEQGPLVLARFGLVSAARVVLEGRFTMRGYDAIDPDLALARDDRYLDTSLAGELDVADRWTVRATVAARRAWSSVPDFRYTKVTAGVGLVYAVGTP